jgi:DNA-binding IscR family transcriptional regulator
MKIPQDVKISIELLEILKNDTTGKPMNVDALAAKIGTTKFFLHKTVRLLAKNGLVTVIRGPGGGLIDSGKDVSLYDVLSVLNHIKQSESVGEKSSKIDAALTKFLKDLLL